MKRLATGLAAALALGISAMLPFAVTAADGGAVVTRSPRPTPIIVGATPTPVAAPTITLPPTDTLR